MLGTMDLGGGLVRGGERLRLIKSPLLCWCGGVWRTHNQSSLCSTGTNKCQYRALQPNLARIKRAQGVFAEETMDVRGLIQHVRGWWSELWRYALHSGRTVVWADNI